MKIVCPQCHFERDIPEDRLPGAAAIATCPQCSHRFRVQRPNAADAASGAAAPHTPENTAKSAPHAGNSAYISSPDADDPLPPGAVIPGHEPEPRPAPGPEARSGQKTAPGQKAVPEAGSGQKAAPEAADPPRQDDEDYRQTAVAAYERQAEQERRERIKAQANEYGQGQDSVPEMDNPWEHPERDGYPAAFYQTAMRVMFAAPRFFAGLRPETPQFKALIFYLVVSLFQILIERFWGGVLSNALAPSATGDPQLQKLLLMLTPQTNILMALLLRSAMVTLELFVAAALYFLVFKLIVPKRANYQLIFQVLAYSAAPALLCVVPVAGSVAGFIWGVACSFVGCRHALGLTWGQTVLGLAPLYVMGLPFLLHLLQSVQTMTG